MASCAVHVRWARPSNAYDGSVEEVAHAAGGFGCGDAFAFGGGEPLGLAAGWGAVDGEDVGEAFGDGLDVADDGDHAAVCGRGFGVDLTAHELRHVHASLLIAAGATPEQLQRSLGHTTGQWTRDTYGHLFTKDLSDLQRRTTAELGRRGLPLPAGA